VSRSQDREVKRLVRDLGRLGWVVTLTKGGHYKAVSPNKDVPIVFIPKTPSEYRSLKNLKSILRRYGVYV
jgi:predicted RNA binding protein YcfA (HicA-like mRNA interferase family)